MINAKALARLENICAMLSSPNDGERATAAAMATRALSALGLDWRALVHRAFVAGAVERDRADAEDDGLACDDEDDIAETLGFYRELGRWGGLNSWERAFLADLLKREVVILSEKQQDCLQKIIRKYTASKGKRWHAA